MSKKYSSNFERDFKFYLFNINNFSFAGSNIRRDYGIQFPNEKPQETINNETGEVVHLTFRIPYDENGKSAKDTFYKLDSQGKSSACREPQLLLDILICKAAVNLQIKQWAQGRAEYTLSLADLKEIINYYKCPEWVLKAVESQKSKILQQWCAGKKYKQHSFFIDAFKLHMGEALHTVNSEHSSTNPKSELVKVEDVRIDKKDPTKTIKLCTRYYNKPLVHGGVLHRPDGPAVEWEPSTDPATGKLLGFKAYHLNGRTHRTDGPAVEYYDGTHEYWYQGKLHRTDGPAVVDCNGYKAWFLNGDRHNPNGRAIIGKRYFERNPLQTRGWTPYNVFWIKGICLTPRNVWKLAPKLILPLLVYYVWIFLSLTISDIYRYVRIQLHTPLKWHVIYYMRKLKMLYARVKYAKWNRFHKKSLLQYKK